MEQKTDELKEDEGDMSGKPKHGAMNRPMETKKYEILEEGTYECEYVGTAEKVSTQDGGKYFSHKWKVINDSEDPQYIFENSSTTLSPKSKLGDIFKACDFKVAEGATLNLKDLVGKKCQLYVVVTPDGKYNSVKTHIPLKK